MPVKRWDAVHVPDLDTLMIINNGFRGCPVIVQPIPGKGLGLVATRKLVSNQTFAYYYGRVLRDIRWASPFCLASAATGEVMDLYAHRWMYSSHQSRGLLPGSYGQS